MKRIIFLLVLVAIKDGKPTDEMAMKARFPCHQAIKDRDFIFTRYTP